MPAGVRGSVATERRVKPAISTESGTGVELEGATVSTRARPLPPPGFVLVLAVMAMSWAGPLVRFSTAPALAIAAWRLILSCLIVAVVLVARGRLGELFRLRATDWVLATVAGLFLAAHFWSWIASLEYTTVASSVVLVSTQPVFVAILSAVFLGERASGRQWSGILVAVVGAAVIGWGDFGMGRSALFGDMLALAGAAFVSGYYVIGRRLRQKLDLWVYVGAVYGVAAVALLLAALLSEGMPMTGFGVGNWLIFVALAAGPMMIGHTGVNYALRYLPAYVANLVVLGEPIGATLIAWALPAIAERPSPQLLVGGILIGGGVLLGLGPWKRRA